MTVWAANVCQGCTCGPGRQENPKVAKAAKSAKAAEVGSADQAANVGLGSKCRPGQPGGQENPKAAKAANALAHFISLPLSISIYIYIYVGIRP